jgi:hypothetical protein
MVEVLLDIAQNASISGMRVNVFSMLDFLKYVCHNHSNEKMMWYSLENQMSAEEVTRSYHLKFKGRGQRNTPCMTILGLQKLLLIMGSKTAVEFCDRVMECFNLCSPVTHGYRGSCKGRQQDPRPGHLGSCT